MDQYKETVTKLEWRVDGTKEGDKNRPRYRSAWGW